MKNDEKNFFERMGKKEKKKFSKLPDSEKTAIISAEINKKINAEMGKIVSDSFLDGYLFAHNILFERYTSKPVSNSEEYNSVIADLTKEIADNAKRYKQRHPDKDESKNETIRKEDE